MCVALPPRLHESFPSDHVETTRANQCKSVPQAKSYPRLRGPRARRRRGGQRCVLLALWNTSFDVAPSPSSSLRRSITLESGAASRGHVDLGLDRR